MPNLDNAKPGFFARHAKAIVLIAVVFGAASGSFTKMITAPSLAIGFYRLLFTLPFFAIPLFVKHRDELKTITVKQILLCALTGFFLFSHFFFWFMAAQTTAIASAVVLVAMHPIVVILVTVFIFKKKVSGKAVAGVAVALAGSIIVAGFDYATAEHTFIGDVYALAAGICMGLYFSMGSFMREKMSANAYIFFMFGFCWFWFAVGTLVTGTPLSGYPASDFFWILCMTIVCQIGSHAVFNWAMGHVSSVYVSAVSIGDIIAASLIAFVLIGEIPVSHQIIGGFIVFAGLLYYNKHESDGQPTAIDDKKVAKLAEKE